MKSRFVCLRWTPVNASAERRARAIAAKLDPESWRVLIDRRGVLALGRVGIEPIIALPNEYGFVIGPLFDRATSEPVREFSLGDADRLTSDAGTSFTQRYWGKYCALLHNRLSDFLHVVRDPGGAAPVYIYSDRTLSCLFSDASDFIAVWDERLDCDEDYLAAFLVQPRLVSRRCAISGTEEILAGECVTLGRVEDRRSMAWRPDTPPNARDLPNADQAQSALRDAVVASAMAWSRWAQQRGDVIAHRLSGGLDSTIVLAALNSVAADDVEIVCVNEFPIDVPEGDERSLATLAARRFRRRLVTVEARPAEVNYEAILDAPLCAKPSRAELSFASGALGDAIALCGAGLVTSGQGGDQVFHRSRTPLIAADAVWDNLSLSEIWTICGDTARLARTPIWNVFGACMVYAIAKRPVALFNPIFSKATFANVDAIELARSEWSYHPWFDRASKTSPARSVRRAHLADLAYYHQPSALTTRFPTAPILASQPVIEAVLAIPPYMMTTGGGDRSLVRNAFADWLPTDIRARSMKGDTTRFHARVLERQLPFLRAFLLDGELARRRLVNRRALEAALSQSSIPDGAMKAALATTFVAEAWLSRFDRSRSLANQPQCAGALED